ncbi:MAG TPA: hypothetical protein VNA12_06535 [Mycobacteriales bacterium]|nr:hypothetical protein [Mycobacteriales bacterium]
MRRAIARLCLLASLLPGVFVPVLAAEDARPDGYLQITGSRTSYTDIVLTRPTSASVASRGYMHADFDTRGTYAGYVLRPLSGRGAWARGDILANWGSPDRPQYFMDHSDFEPLRAGRYRLYLITDGATRFKVTLPGYGATIVAKPAKPFAAEFEYRELGPGLPGAWQTVDRQPFFRGPKAHGMMAYFHRYNLPVTSDDSWQCLVRPGGSCQDADAYAPRAFCPGVSVSAGPGWKQCTTNIHYANAPSPLGAVELVTEVDVVGDASRFSVFRVNAELP